MKIYHDREYGLSIFRAKKVTGKVKTTDHHAVILTLDLLIPTVKQHRKSNFNVKDKEGQLMFHHMTSNSSKLGEAFSTRETFKTHVLKWEK